jgi:outer membrane receptor for ferrienterochelin and colicins
MRYLSFFLLCFPFWLQAQKDSLVCNLDAAVCTAVLTPTSVRNAVHPMKIIDSKTIEQRSANNLEELLTGETNFRFKNDAILGNGVQMGGIGGEDVKVLIDGIPVIGRLNGNIDLSQIPLHNVASVEITQGSLSTIYGNNSAGGVINIITKKTQIKAFEARINSQIESVNIQNHNLNVGYKFKKLLLQAGGNFYDFSGSPYDTTRAVLWNPKQQYSATATAKYYIDEIQQVTFTTSQFKEKIVNLGEVKLANRENAYAFDDYYYTNRADYNLNYQGNWKKLAVQSTVAFNRFYRLKESFQTRVKLGTQVQFFDPQDTSAFTGFLTRSVANYQFNKMWNVQSGIETFLESAQSGRIIDPTEEKLHEASIGDYAFFTSAKIQLFQNQRLTLQPSFRISYNTKYNAPLTPSFNFLYKLGKNWSVRGGYANSFRAPSMKELYFNFVDSNHDVVGNTDLKAERAHNFILTPKFTFERAEHAFNIESQLFYNQFENRIALTQYGDPKLVKFTYMNIGEYKTKGINTSLSYQFKNQLTLRGSYTYTGFYNDLRAQRVAVPTYIYSPEASLELNYLVPHTGFTINVLYRYVGATPNFSYNVIQKEISEGLIDAYELLNLTITKSFWNNKLNIAIGGKNLFDVRNITQSGNLGTGHGATSASVPINLGSSVFVRLGANF